MIRWIACLILALGLFPPTMEAGLFGGRNRRKAPKIKYGVSREQQRRNADKARRVQERAREKRSRTNKAPQVRPAQSGGSQS
ncbi:MAG: hypothetical protein HY235_15265 [Acidobacteria bacterium]|nr:hypothetical protein [Acidobacteriota bacterium]